MGSRLMSKICTGLQHFAPETALRTAYSAMSNGRPFKAAVNRRQNDIYCTQTLWMH